MEELIEIKRMAVSDEATSKVHELQQKQEESKREVRNIEIFDTFTKIIALVNYCEYFLQVAAIATERENLAAILTVCTDDMEKQVVYAKLKQLEAEQNARERDVFLHHSQRQQLIAAQLDSQIDAHKNLLEDEAFAKIKLRESLDKAKQLEQQNEEDAR